MPSVGPGRVKSAIGCGHRQLPKAWRVGPQPAANISCGHATIARLSPPIQRLY